MSVGLLFTEEHVDGGIASLESRENIRGRKLLRSDPCYMGTERKKSMGLSARAMSKAETTNTED